MNDLIVFVEEESARIVVKALAEKFAPPRRVVCVGHNGKNDLKASFPRK